MAEHSTIEWTDHTWSEQSLSAPRFAQVAGAVRLVVLKLVAVMAERDAVSDIKPQVRKVGIWLDVVGTKVAALSITAPPTGEAVTLENRQSPILVLGLAAVALLALPRPVLPRIVLGAALPVLPDSGRDLRLGFRRNRHTAAGEVRLAGAQRAHRGPRLGRVRPSFEGAHTTLRRARLLHPRAVKALRLPLIPARAVNSELTDLLPVLAACAPFQAGGNARRILHDGQAAFAGCCFDDAFWSAGHG